MRNSNAARITVLLVAVAVVVAVLALWKRSDRRAAIRELETRFGAQLSIRGDDFEIGCSSPLLDDLREFAALVRRAGRPTVLDLTGSPSLRSLAGVGVLESLVSIVAIDCPALVSAEGVAGLPRLSEISLLDSANFDDASAIRDLPSLATLDLSGCAALEAIELSGLPSLASLYLSRCRKLRELDLSPVPDLRQLYLDGCGGLVQLDGLGRLSSLTDLDASNATSLATLPGIEQLGRLVVLDLRNVAMEDFSALASLPELRVLRLGGQDAIETLEPFSGLSALRELHLEACPNLRSLRGVPPGLTQYAGFTHCPGLVSLDGLEAAAGLQQIDVGGCAALTNVSAVAELGEVVQLNFAKCRSLTDIRPVEGLAKLVIVFLGGSGVVPAAVESLKLANPDAIFEFAAGE